ncbi:MAG TPA: YceI family protein [Polyangia bacterium]|nr:YceI family protein [Polyangia bacterium]
MTAYEDATRYVPHQTHKLAEGGELERWQVDLAHSSLRFSLRHIVVQKINGRFNRWGGTLDLDRRAPWMSTIRVWIDLASIETNAPERDAHVRSAEFLDVARFPLADFESTSVDPRADRLVVRGRLRLHGVGRDVELEVTPRGLDAEGRDVYAMRAKIDRQAFGLHWNQDLDVGGVVVGDEIEIVAEVAIVREGGDEVEL